LLSSVSGPFAFQSDTSHIFVNFCRLSKASSYKTGMASDAQQTEKGMLKVDDRPSYYLDQHGQGRRQVFRAEGVQVEWLSIYRIYPLSLPFIDPKKLGFARISWVVLLEAGGLCVGSGPLDPPSTAAPEHRHMCTALCRHSCDHWRSQDMDVGGT